jgi:hypothetical protein
MFESRTKKTYQFLEIRAIIRVKVRRERIMNIPELSTALANVNLQNQVGIAVLGKALDNTETVGESLIQMMDRSMELSVNPAVGSNFDMYV